MIDKDDLKVRRHLKEFIPQRLEELGMTEAELARMTGDGPMQINRAARGLHTPSLVFALRLAKALQCSIPALSGVAELVES